MNLHDLWKNEVKPSSRRSTDIRPQMLHLGWNNLTGTTRIIGIKETLKNLDGLVVICSNPMSAIRLDNTVAYEDIRVVFLEL